MHIRNEQAGDAPAIHLVTKRAFAMAEHSDGSEPGIVDALRAAGALTLSLVAEEAGAVVGHVAFSPVRIGAASSGWFGLGPVSVSPERQDQGVGTALIRQGLDMLRAEGTAGCVVLGEPGYYTRFGFRAHSDVVFEGVTPEYFMTLAFGSNQPLGKVTYHAAFYPDG